MLDALLSRQHLAGRADRIFMVYRCLKSQGNCPTDSRTAVRGRCAACDQLIPAAAELLLQPISWAALGLQALGLSALLMLDTWWLFQPRRSGIWGRPASSPKGSQISTFQ